MSRIFPFAFALVCVAGLTACEQAQNDAPPAESETGAQIEDSLESGLSNLREAGDDLAGAAGIALDDLARQVPALQETLNSLSNETRAAISSELERAVTTLEDVRDQNLSDAQKAEAVMNTRRSAEQSAQAAGLSAGEIENAADGAEQTARDMLDYRGPLTTQ